MLFANSIKREPAREERKGKEGAGRESESESESGEWGSINVNGQCCRAAAVASCSSVAAAIAAVEEMAETTYSSVEGRALNGGGRERKGERANERTAAREYSDMGKIGYCKKDASKGARCDNTFFLAPHPNLHYCSCCTQRLDLGALRTERTDERAALPSYLLQASSSSGRERSSIKVSKLPVQRTANGTSNFRGHLRLLP